MDTKVPSNISHAGALWLGAGGSGLLHTGDGNTHSLLSSPPACSAWAAALCSHRSWIAALQERGAEGRRRRIMAAAETPGLGRGNGT